MAFVDKELGELVAAIEGGPRAGRVAWLVHGSQGEGFDEHDFRGHAGEVYDEALRVPLVVAAPLTAAGKPGRYDRAAVSILDVAATVVDLAGAAADGLAGTSLAPVIRGRLRPGAPTARVRSEPEAGGLDRVATEAHGIRAQAT